MPNGQFPVILAGQVLTAGLLQGFAPLTAYKTADTSRATATTLANDPDLTVPVTGSGIYLWLMMLDYEGGTQGSSDLKFQMTVPTSATARFWMGNISTAGVSTTSFMGLQGTGYSAGTNGAGNLRGLLAVGSLIGGGTAGNLTLQWAQNTSSATATIVHGGSVLAAWRMA